MKTILLTCLFLTSCVNYQGPDGTKFTMVGTNVETVVAGGLRMENVNQAKAIDVAGEHVSNWVRIKAWFGLAEKGVDVADTAISAATGQ